MEASQPINHSKDSQTIDHRNSVRQLAGDLVSAIDDPLLTPPSFPINLKVKP